MGGTTLNKASNARGWTETAWSGTGSGCSPYVAKPSWQTDTGCSMRMESDVAAVADPDTGMSVYNTQGGGGWGVVGGTSAASPLVAGSLTSLGIANGHFTPAWVWQNAENFFDITTGNNGTCTGSPAHFCTAGTGYDGPTGWGTVNGSLLQSALPPGSNVDAGASCADPGGSYSLSCTDCVAGIRSTGCTLTCESCTKIDGTQNTGPILALPCAGAGTVSNDDGALVCDAASVAEAGAEDGGEDGSTDGSQGGEAGNDGSTAPPPMDSGTESDDGGSELSMDASLSEDGSTNGASASSAASSSGGCGCSSVGAGHVPSSIAFAVGGACIVGLRRRRRVRRERR